MYLYSILGIINVLLIALITAPYWLRRASKWLFPKKKIMASKGMKALRALHKPLGICLLIVSLIHGYLAWGSLRPHTGTLLGAAVLITVALGGAFYRLKKKGLFKAHKIGALAVVLLTLLHLIAPSAIYYIFG